MNNSSLIIGAVFGIIIKIKDFYDNSYISSQINIFVAKLKEYFSSSNIWGFVKKRDYLTTVWEYSFIFVALNKLFNYLNDVCSKLYHRKFKNISEGSSILNYLSGSIIFRSIRMLLIRFDLLVGVSIALIAVINHRYWNNLYATFIVLVLFAIYSIKVILHKFQGFNLKSIDFGLFVFAFTVIVAEFTGLYPSEGFRFFVFYLTCFMYVFLISNSFRTVRALNSMIEIVLLGITITGIYAIYQSIIGIPSDPSLTDINISGGLPGRVFSTMQNPNSYAEVLILTLPFYASAIFNTKSTLKRIVLSIMAVPPLFALLATGSRSSWIGMAVAVLVFVFFKERKLIPVAILLGILSFPLLQIVSPSVYKRLMTIFIASKDSSFNYRGFIYETFKPMLKDFWLTGIGLGNGTEKQSFMKILQRYPLHQKLNYITPPHTHNLYFQIWIEVGIVGIVSFVWFNIRMIKNSMISIFSQNDKNINNILIAGVSAILGSLVMGFAEYTWFYVRAMIFFWIDIGIIMSALSMISKKKEGLCRSC